MNLKKLVSILTSKMAFVAYLILLQLLFLLSVVSILSAYSRFINHILNLLSIFMVIYIMNKDENPSYKLAWIVVIMLVPIFGGLLYLLFGGQKVPKALMRRDHESQLNVHKIISQDKAIMDEIRNKDENAYKQANYLWKNADFPVYKRTQTTFLPSGEVKFEKLVAELKKAKKFIFLEYFIIEEGIMWNTILDVLVEKVNQGVDVRLMYDDAGCIPKLDPDYYKKIQALGIQCKVFNPIHAKLAIQMNNRDHRKIVVIDGLVGFTGGINLADEYMNAKTVYGHWKDCSLMLRGEAVWNFTLMFLQFWNYDEKISDDYLLYKADEHAFDEMSDDGYVQPFSDSPTDDEHVGENIHISLVNAANRYIFIQTPYLVLDNEMKTSLELASKCGVDVRIMVPHIPDKKFVFEVTRANYRSLLKNGVKIYEYTPGFVHAKTMVTDDKLAVIGTINLDFRSYYLHYECGVWLYESRAVMDLKADYLKTLEKCEEITYENYMKSNILRRAYRSILSLFSPLL